MGIRRRGRLGLRLQLQVWNLILAPFACAFIIQLPSLPSTSLSFSEINKTPHKSSFGICNRHFLESCHAPLLATTSSEIATEDAESLFQKHCDKNGLMTKSTLFQIAFFVDLMEDGDLLEEELEDMWKSASKFPTEIDSEERIDVDSFIQIYRDIDDLFEDDDENGASVASVGNIDDNTGGELETSFKSMSKDGLVSKETMIKWNEIQSLMEEGLLGEDEFETMWNNTPKIGNDRIDLEGFIRFNAALDELFEFEDDEEEEAGEPVAVENTFSKESTIEKPSIDDVDLSPAALFEALSGSDGLIGMDDLERWGELQEMLEEGEVMPLEVENFFDEIAKDSEHPNKLKREGFLALYNKIDSLFEDMDDDEEKEDISAPSMESEAFSSVRKQLMDTIYSLNEDEERLPCGLEATEREQRYVQELVAALESEPGNIIQQREGAIEMADLAGEWELLYSSSSAMAYNKGLSGLGGSFPNGSFGGLKMKLQSSKFMSDVEYTERINVVPDSASFDVKVNGDWELRSSVSIFTGQPSIVLTVIPERVTYGPTSTRADHWKSLGPTNMLDVTYLDDSIRVMRGNTSTDSILIFKRI